MRGLFLASALTLVLAQTAAANQPSNNKTPEPESAAVSKQQAGNNAQNAGHTKPQAGASEQGGATQKPDRPDPKAQARNTPALSALLDQGATVKRVFSVGDHLRGWQIDFAGKTDVYYTSKGGDFLLLGALVDRQGNNVTKKIEQALAKNEAKSGDSSGGADQADAEADAQDPGAWKNAIWRQAKNANAVTLGDSGKDIYVFFEPTCGYCARLHYRMQDMDVTAHYIMVSFLSPQSKQLAKTLYSLPEDKQQAGVDKLVMDNLAGGSHQAWVKKYSQYSTDLNVPSVLDANAALMRDAGFSGTPGIVYKDANGDVQFQKGVPSQSRLESILQE